eukprot:4217390-Amphidinium_carterae.2
MRIVVWQAGKAFVLLQPFGWRVTKFKATLVQWHVTVCVDRLWVGAAAVDRRLFDWSCWDSLDTVLPDAYPKQDGQGSKRRLISCMFKTFHAEVCAVYGRTQKTLLLGAGAAACVLAAPGCQRVSVFVVT